MHQTAEVVGVSDVDVGRHPEDRQVTEPRTAIRLEIPLPAHGPAGLHRQPEPIVGEVALGFSAPELGHVEARANVPGERTLGIEQWFRIVEDPTVFAVVSPKAILHHERFTTVEGPDVRVQAVLPICGMYTHEAIADFVFEGTAGEVEPRLVEVSAALVGAGNPDEQRQRIGHLPEQLVAVSSRWSDEAHIATSV